MKALLPAMRGMDRKGRYKTHNETKRGILNRLAE